MVKELRKDRQTLYVCASCGFAYKEKELVEQCQQWCEQN